MKRRVNMVLLFSIVFLCTSCAGLQRENPSSNAETANYQISFDEALAEINARHKSIIKPTFDVGEFETRYVRDKAPREFKLEKTPISEKAGYLSAAQMKRDAYILVHNLRNGYSLYDYYGGDEKFDAVLADIEAAVTEAGEMDTVSFNYLLSTSFSFIEDQHFAIGGWNFAPRLVTAFYRETAFGKTDGKYVNLKTGKSVKSVEGFPELDALFRLSLSNDYQLVYYPVIQISVPYLELADKYHKGIQKEAAENLQLTYSDDSTQELPGFIDYWGITAFSPAEADIHETDGIPVLRTTQFSQVSQRDMMRFLNENTHQTSLVVDLRRNPGGDMVTGAQWFERYTGCEVGRNIYSVFFGSLEKVISDLSIFGKHMKDYLQGVGNKYAVIGGEEDVFIENPDRLLVVLMSKFTSSAAEVFIDYGHNVENVLFVGDASHGCMINNQAYSSIKLPCSYLPFSMGTSVCVPPDEDYFREGRGFLPDIWVPAEEAEELICGFLQQMQSK